jgi:WD40 repeat protein
MNDNKHIRGSHQNLVKIFEGHEDAITSIAAFPDGQKIATGSEDMTIRIWRLEDSMEIMKWVVGKRVGALIILRQGTLAVSSEGEVSDDDDATGCWQLWVREAETGRVVAGPLKGHTNMVFALSVFGLRFL